MTGHGAGGRALVTGASGLLGAAICSALCRDPRRKAPPIAVLRPTSDPWRLEGLSVERRVADLEDPATLRGLTDGASVVYHAAAAWQSEAATDATFTRVNVDGSRRLVEEAARSGVKRFVHVSTVGVHGAIRNPPADESAPLRPGDRYQRSKLASEQAVLEAVGRHHPLESVIVRPVGIYGPNDRRFLKLFRAVARRRFVMIGSGRVLYHLTHVDDLADGILRAGTTPGVSGRAYILCGPDVTTLAELVGILASVLGVRPPRLRIPVAPVYAAAFVCEKMCALLGVEPPLYRRRVDFFRKDRAFTSAAAARDLGYAPRIMLREGLARTAAAYRTAGLLP